LSKIVSIGTSVPEYKHEQGKIFEFMHRAYATNETEKRKLRFLYNHSGIDYRYSVLPDFSTTPDQWQFFTPAENLEPFPTIDERMQAFHQYAAPLAMKAINECLDTVSDKNITHLITVSCTGMSAPGLDLEIMELMGLPVTTWRTSVNFMGCYAAIHAMKLADAICKADNTARVLFVCVECCTLHFQKDYSEDAIVSSLLFGDGAAAVLISANEEERGLKIGQFYSMVSHTGKKDMVWEVSSKGYLMTLSGYIADLIGEDFDKLVQGALTKANLDKDDVTHWCIHPGGKKILEAIHKSLGFTNGQLQTCYDVLKDYGNMSSPTVLFVLDRIRQSLDEKKNNTIFGAAFGPGLTMETFILKSS